MRDVVDSVDLRYFTSVIGFPSGASLARGESWAAASPGHRAAPGGILWGPLPFLGEAKPRTDIHLSQQRPAIRLAGSERNLSEVPGGEAISDLFYDGIRDSTQ